MRLTSGWIGALEELGIVCSYWPRTTTELHEYIAKCDVCLAHRLAQGKEPLLQHDINDRPWSKIGIDICELRGHTLLVMCGYFSNYIEVETLSKANTRTVTKALKIMYVRYGVPDTVITDNGPQFSSEDFSSFAGFCTYNILTILPRIQWESRKFCEDSQTSLFKVLRIRPISWQNTPSEGIGISPAQRFLGRQQHVTDTIDDTQS